IAAGAAPDAAMLKVNALPRLIEMGALEPLEPWLDAWPGKAEILPDLFPLVAAADGTQYYLPLQYVVLYLYYRTDWLAEAGLEPPTTCDEFLTVANAFTHDGRYGFGFRGGRGGHDHWATFTLSRE